jgi:hypothetical protein
MRRSVLEWKAGKLSTTKITHSKCKENQPMKKINNSSNEKIPQTVGMEKKSERNGKEVKQEQTKEKRLLRLNLQGLLQKLEAAKNAPKKSVPEEDVE